MPAILKNIPSLKGATTVAILVALCLVFALLDPNFVGINNVQNVLRQVAVTAIVAAAVTLVMVSGGLDLSVGGVVALSGVSAALLVASGMPVWLGFLAGVVVGLLVGLVNGLLVVGLGINSVIATLGTMTMTRGIAQLLTNGSPVHQVPSEFRWLGTGFFGPIPIPVVIMVIVVVAFIIIQKRTLLGKYTFAIGSNVDAARLSGIRVNKVRIQVFVLAGGMAGLGGVILASRLNSGQPNAGLGFEFAVIVAAVLGGTSLAGGEGRVSGTLVGALIVAVLGNGLNLLGVQTFWQNVVEGAVLILAVALDILLRKIGRRRTPVAAGSAVSLETTTSSDSAVEADASPEQTRGSRIG